MGGVGAAQPGWTSERPNMQPVAQLTSYMPKDLQSGLMWSSLGPSDL